MFVAEVESSILNKI